MGSMKPLALLGLLLGGVLVLSACFQAPPPPPPQGGCTPQASGKALSSQGHDLLGLQGLGDFSSPYAPGELLVLFGGVAPQALLAQVEGIQPLGKVGSSFFRVRTRVGQERATAQALLRLGGALRGLFPGLVVAVGGSSGKTTTKEALAQGLEVRYKARARRLLLRGGRALGVEVVYGGRRRGEKEVVEGEFFLLNVPPEPLLGLPGRAPRDGWGAFVLYGVLPFAVPPPYY
ncbi:MAG: hypothetical protein N2324_10055, partial [Thermus sp.]|nr:hypothetical protein [Thermus sp.]